MILLKHVWWLVHFRNLEKSIYAIIADHNLFYFLIIMIERAWVIFVLHFVL